MERPVFRPAGIFYRLMMSFSRLNSRAVRTINVTVHPTRETEAGDCAARMGPPVFRVAVSG
jgi:hypothetical protein